MIVDHHHFQIQLTVIIVAITVVVIEVEIEIDIVHVIGTTKKRKIKILKIRQLIHHINLLVHGVKDDFQWHVMLQDINNFVVQNQKN